MKHRFKDLVDVRKLQELTDELYAATSIPSSVIAMDGEILTGSGWQRICTDFHRRHPKIEHDCIESDTRIRAELERGEPFVIYRCPRGLVDASAPIVIDGEHLANVFCGQVFLEPPDEAVEQAFRKQAREFGFDEAEYMEAFKEVPVFTRERFRAAVSFLARLSELIADMGRTRLNELKALRVVEESHATARALLNASADSAFLLELDGTIVTLNDVAAQRLGKRKDALIGRRVHDLLPAPLAEFRMQQLEAAIQREEALHFEDERDGISFEHTVYPILDPHGRVIRVAVFGRDVTGYKRAVEALENERAFLSAVLDNIQEAIVICDREGRLIRFNESARRLHGLPEEPIPPERWAEHYDLLQLDGVTPLAVDDIPLFRALQGEGVRDAEIVVAPKHSRARALVCSGQTLKGEAGEVIGAVVAMHDITERKRAQEERERLTARLYQAQKMESVGTLAGGIAHDFNNILSIILGNAELSLLDTPKASPTCKSLQEIHKASLRARDLVNQILLFARRKEHTVTDVDIGIIARESLMMLRASIPSTVAIQADIEEALPAVLGDASQVQQVILNLCANAGQVMEAEGGTLDYKVGAVELPAPLDTMTGPIPAGRYVRIHVGDTGPGIQPKHLEHIFEPFFTTKSVGEGTGLGLAVVHGIVQEREGGILVESEEGGGTVFTVYLPVAEKVRAGKAEAQPSTLPGGTERVLLVDDEPMILEVARRMLEHHGYRVETRESGTDALAYFEQDPDRFDLVLTDMTMPGMRGDRLAEAILGIRPETPVILSSGYSKQISDQRAKDLGIRAFVSKPLTAEKLLLTVRKVLDEKG